MYVQLIFNDQLYIQTWNFILLGERSLGFGGVNFYGAKAKEESSKTIKYSETMILSPWK